MFSIFQRTSGEALIRPLTSDDWADLEAMIASNQLAFLYAAEHLEHFGLPAPSALNSYRSAQGFMGIFEPLNEAEPLANTGLEQDAVTASSSSLLKYSASQLAHRFPPQVKEKAQSLLPSLARVLPGYKTQSQRPDILAPGQSEALGKDGKVASTQFRLVGAFWLGSNCVPIIIPERHRRQVATLIARAHRTTASIFGSAQDVLPLWELLQPKMGNPLSVREEQPLLYLPPEKDLSHLVQQSLYRAQLSHPQVSVGGARWARTSDRASLLKASVAMFTEEIGYDPLSRDAVGYSRRIDDFIRTGRSLVATNDDEIVVFKADLGLAHADTCQIQGVWLHPAYRGFGLSEPLLAQAFELIRPRFPHISLYVNGYNTRARKLYAALGMEQEDTFATILF